jgi:membrane protease YdiL (CAAX protease family)
MIFSTLKKDWRKLTDIPRLEAPKKKDLIPFIVSFLLLWTAATVFSFIGAIIPEDIAFEIERPDGIAAWLFISFELLLASYAEEGIFRYYLLNALSNFGASGFAASVFSSLSFALLHGYEGVLGVFYALTAGFLLSGVYLKTKSLHGIALSHALYNFLVYFFA